MLAVLMLNDYSLFRKDLSDACFKVNGNLISLKEITQVACIRQANTLSYDKVVHHFNDDGLLSLQIKVIGYLASCKTAADNRNCFTDFLITKKIINSLNSGMLSINIKNSGLSTGRNDDLVSVENANVLDFSVKSDIN